MCGDKWKVGLWNMKTKIYQTIKGLIILFIKLQFFNQVQLAFRSLCTSVSNIYLNLILNLNGFITCIIPNTFVSSPIRLITPDVHQQKSLYIQLSQVQAYILIRFRLMYSSGLGLHTRQIWGPLVYPPGGLHHSSPCPHIYRRRSWRPYKREVLAASSKAFINTATKGCSSIVHPMTQQVGDLQDG